MSIVEGVAKTGNKGRLRDWLASGTITDDVLAKIIEAMETGYISGGGGVTEHGELTGLEDDDHAQYHTDARGDTKYYTKAQTDGIKTELEGEIDSDISVHAALANIHHVAFESADCDEKITTHSSNQSAHHSRYSDSEARTAAVSDEIYGAAWDGVTTIAPSKNAVYDKIQTIQGGDVTYLEKLAMYGSANAEWVPLIFETASPDGDNVGIPAGAAVCEVSNVVYAAAEWTYGLALPPAKNGMKLYVAASGIRFFLSAANSTNYVTNSWLIGVNDAGTVTTIATDATDYNTTGLKTLANSLTDLSGYEKVFVKLGSTQATANALKIKFVSMKVYYST